MIFPSRENEKSQTLRTETVTQFLGTSGILTMFNDILGLNGLGETAKTVRGIVQDLTGNPPVANDISKVNTQIVEKLLKTPGMTQYRGQHFIKATPKFKLKDGTILKTYKNSARVDHVFLADSNGRMLFAGYVGWIHSDCLEATIAEIKETFV